MDCHDVFLNTAGMPALKSVFALLSSKRIPKPVHSHRALYCFAINRFRFRQFYPLHDAQSTSTLKPYLGLLCNFGERRNSTQKLFCRESLQTLNLSLCHSIIRRVEIMLLSVNKSHDLVV